MARTTTEKSLMTEDQVRQIVSALDNQIVSALDKYNLDRAITPRGSGNVICGGGHDAAGCYVTSLTESVMGVTAGLCKIAEAIEKLSEAVSAQTVC